MSSTKTFASRIGAESVAPAKSIVKSAIAHMPRRR
jgi:hypothetical protein